MVQVPTDTSTVNMSHIIHQMAFGQRYPGQINPLDGMALLLLHASGLAHPFVGMPKSAIGCLWVHLQAVVVALASSRCNLVNTQ